VVILAGELENFLKSNARDQRSSLDEVHRPQLKWIWV